MKSMKTLAVSGKRVLVRVDFNVPLDDKGNVTDDTRIRFVMPTITWLMENNARVILCSHLGRPKGKPDPAFTLAPAAKRLQELLGKPVIMADDCIGDKVTAMINGMKNGDVIMLENLRFHPGEADNDDGFARTLAALCDIYINDAFAVSHRANASVEAIVKHAPVCAAGLLLEKEITAFRTAMESPKRPLVAIVGGAKVSSKLKALYSILNSVDSMIIGGAMANTFLAAKGGKVGKSKIEPDLIEDARKILAQAVEKKIAIYLPVDAMAADSIDQKTPGQIVPIDSIPDQAMVLDIGPATVSLFAGIIAGAGTVIWNGPMGIFETPVFAAGTNGVAEAVAKTGAYTIAGGGDTVAAVEAAGVTDKLSYISTGGGAFLSLMEGEPLPGVAVLEKQCGA
ncbi:MAG: phosphoglycerate kinase [Thermodesulfobacteriota bacterium]